ncbi:MAG: nucleotidyltransferase domain-containing protein [Phycisphaerae bacterium]|nr:nucleotidyltransferase domain-containing protein [Phycisphaerae bacterium]
MTQRLKSILSELRGQLADLYGRRLVRVVLYGSQARDEAAESSDIDLLVVLDGPVSPGEEISRAGDTVARISLANNVVISCAFVSERRIEAEHSPFLMNVRREGVAV